MSVANSGDYSDWLDLCYRYDGSYPLSLLHLELSAKLYEVVRDRYRMMMLLLTDQDENVIHGGIRADSRGVTLVDAYIDLIDHQDLDSYAGVREACRTRRPQLESSAAQGLVLIDLPLISGNRIVGCLELETTTPSNEVMQSLEVSATPRLLAGALRFAETVRQAFLERRYLMCSVNIHQHYKKDLSSDHILDAVCFHIQTTLELDRCLIMGDTNQGWRRFCSGLSYAEEGPSVVDPGPWSALAPYEAKIEGTVIMFPLPTRGGHTAVVIFDHSISQTRFREPEIQQLAMVRDALAVLWAFTEDLASERNAVSVDGLTGSWNRSYGIRFIAEWLENLRHKTDTFAVLFIDVDRFKDINDGYGYLIGDRTLKALAEGLITLVGRRGVVIRYGGDEFLVACPQMNAKEGERLAESLVKLSPWPTDLPQPSISVGLALGPMHGETPEDLIDSADRAMYRAKRSGGNRWLTATLKAACE